VCLRQFGLLSARVRLITFSIISQECQASGHVYNSEHLLQILLNKLPKSAQVVCYAQRCLSCATESSNPHRGCFS
jgi:hypothetical protein